MSYTRRTDHAWTGEENKNFVETDLPETTVDVYEKLSAIILSVRGKLITPENAVTAIRQLNKDAQKAGLPVDIQVSLDSLKDRFEDGYRSSSLGCGDGESYDTDLETEEYETSEEC